VYTQFIHISFKLSMSPSEMPCLKIVNMMWQIGGKNYNDAEWPERFVSERLLKASRAHEPAARHGAECWPARSRYFAACWNYQNQSLIESI
jgi:hypothetical protein